MSNFKTVNLFFQDPSYNYSTSVNPFISDDDLIKTFKGIWLNFGCEGDDMQKCIECTVDNPNKELIEKTMVIYSVGYDSRGECIYRKLDSATEEEFKEFKRVFDARLKVDCDSRLSFCYYVPYKTIPENLRK